ncbi:MAG: Ni/Fe hydrogenase subunit alpha [Actinobacteria bacterium]|nr:Ni/Fe hydrogenase subunit alpha [Actinomycetota bacterium]
MTGNGGSNGGAGGARTVEVNVDYVSRVEGHGNIVVVAENDLPTEVRFEVTEPPRFFEAMLRGRPYDQAPLITSRICGICSNGHVLASITAMEATLGITPTRQTKLLRRLLMHGETIQSHVLHAYFLVAPDFFDVGSVVPLAGTHPEVVKRALRLKKLGNDLCEVVGGRAVHQVAAVVGGFTHLPTPEALTAVRTRLVEAGGDLQETVTLFASLDMPAFSRPTEYLSLTYGEAGGDEAGGGEAYAFFGDHILSSEGGTIPVSDYRDKVRERVVAHSSAKHCAPGDGTATDTFMVGALARLNNGFDRLSDGAKAAAADLGFQPTCTNTFMNTVAQLIETVHCVEDSVMIIDRLLDEGLKAEPPEVEIRAGRGAGAVEVPRGTLYHEYAVDDAGLIVEANLIIPTGQNLANLEQDMWALAPQVLPQGKEKAQKAMEMLVRAYDPCISCSTHVIYLDGEGNESAGDDAGHSHRADHQGTGASGPEEVTA